jgi:hypothetical protein
MAFRQIASVLNPGAISVHRFPGPNMPFEGHVYLPFPAICHNKAYLKTWALLGKKAPSQRGLSWREVFDANVLAMQTVNYQSKRYLRACAKQAKVDIAFFEVARRGDRSADRRKGKTLRSRQNFGQTAASAWVRLSQRKSTPTADMLP